MSNIKKLDWYWRSGGGPTPIGEFLNDNFDRMSLGSNYNVVGASGWTPNGTHLVMNGTASGFAANGLKYKFKHAWENWTQRVLYTVGFTPGSTSNGLGIGHQAYFTPNPNTSICANLKMSTGTNYGELRLYQASTLLTTSGDTLTIVNGEQYEVTMTKVTDYDDVSTTFTVTAKRISTGDEISLTHSIDWYSCGGEFALQAFGGAMTVQNWTINVQDKKDIPYLALGDSIAYGRVATTIGQRYVNLLTNDYAASGVLSDFTERVIERLDSIIYQNPTNVILQIGTNDLESLSYDREAVVQPNYQTIRNTLVAAGINVIHLEMLPRNANADVALFNSWLASTFTSDTIVPLYDDFTTNSGTWFADSVHPNQTGMTAIKDAINAAL